MLLTPEKNTLRLEKDSDGRKKHQFTPYDRAFQTLAFLFAVSSNLLMGTLWLKTVSGIEGNQSILSEIGKRQTVAAIYIMQAFFTAIFLWVVSVGEYRIGGIIVIPFVALMAGIYTYAQRKLKKILVKGMEEVGLNNPGEGGTSRIKLYKQVLQDISLTAFFVVLCLYATVICALAFIVLEFLEERNFSQPESISW
eukprot:CAMPEP_0184048366 /NCGR_PEP_ID=MMETSP0956-20121227/2732_1 /TAXON_ID=627963 /ORGANISM="Aplanochytrium sp, Strain PBS07" /LENGTH=195 /DNA_ID=CAMNT_0026340373 /DNA_START=593 /DNA_END=1177 /DNA_ORIENTATION=-